MYYLKTAVSCLNSILFSEYDKNIQVQLQDSSEYIWVLTSSQWNIWKTSAAFIIIILLF